MLIFKKIGTYCVRKGRVTVSRNLHLVEELIIFFKHTTIERRCNERREMVTFLPVLSLCSSRSEEVLSVVYSVSAAVPAPQQL